MSLSSKRIAFGYLYPEEDARMLACVPDVLSDGAERAKGIPLQDDLVQGYGDDSAEMQTVGGGAPTVNLVVPARYTHVHNGIINRHDFDGMVDLVVALIQRLDAATVARLKDFTPE